MGQPIIVENRPGAGGNTGTARGGQGHPRRLHAGRRPAPARSRPTSSLYKELGYEPEKDFEMISPFAGFTIVIVASKKLPVKTLNELVDLCQGAAQAAQLRLGRHRQLAASGRRIFRADHRRQAHPRALSQHRAIHPRPDGRARCRSASSGFRTCSPRSRAEAPRRSRSRTTSAWRRCPTFPPPPRPACRNTQLRLVRAAGAERNAEADRRPAERGVHRRAQGSERCGRNSPSRAQSRWS